MHAVRIREFDRDFAEEIIERLKALPPDRAPLWGKMKAAELVPHLTQSMLYSMGRRGTRPFVGNWFTRRVIGPLVLGGWVPILKNVQLGPAAAPDTAHFSLDDLQAVLTEYLSAVETGALQPEPHQMFGDIGVDGWARMHAQHFEHHFKQFGL